MLMMLPLLLSDPNLPEDTRRRLQGSPHERKQALLALGLSCADAHELAGPDAPPCPEP